MISKHRLMMSTANVERWGTIPHLRKATVAQHCFEVAVTVDWILGWVAQNGRGVQLTDEFKLDCIRYALAHDAIEGLTNDCPSPPKRLGWVTENEHLMREHVDAPEAATPFVKLVVKTADRLCMLRDTLAEVALGNSFFESLKPKCRELYIEFGVQLMDDLGIDDAEADRMAREFLQDCPPLIGVSHDLEKMGLV